MQEQPFPLAQLRRDEDASVPTNSVEAALADPALFRFRRERLPAIDDVEFI
jgi:hypothetical protein